MKLANLKNDIVVTYTNNENILVSESYSSNNMRNWKRELIQSSDSFDKAHQKYGASDNGLLILATAQKNSMYDIVLIKTDSNGEVN